MENVVAYKKEIIPVGKWIPDSKVRYRWCLKINDTPYIVSFINSKVSRMVRVLINEKPIFTEKKDKNTPFHFKLAIENLNLVIKKHPLNNDYDLFIEDQDYEYLSRCTTRNCPPDLFVEANKNLYRDFTVSQRDDCFQISKSQSTMGDPSEANDPATPRHRLLNYMAVSDNPSYSESLNDSGHLFKTEYFFLNITDINEEKALVKRVNNFA